MHIDKKLVSAAFPLLFGLSFCGCNTQADSDKEKRDAYAKGYAEGKASAQGDMEKNMVLSVSERKTARANMQTIANGLQAYKVRDASHQYPTNLTALTTDLGRDFSASPPDNAGPGTRTYTFSQATAVGTCQDGNMNTITYYANTDSPIPIIRSNWANDGCFVPSVTAK